MSAARFVYNPKCAAVLDMLHGADQAVSVGYLHVPRAERSQIVDAAGFACAEALNAAYLAARSGAALPKLGPDSRHTVGRGRYGNIRVHDGHQAVLWVARREKTEKGEAAALAIAEICAEALNASHEARTKKEGGNT